MNCLRLNDNNVSDISVLAQYDSLWELKLQNNNITNIDSLKLFLKAAIQISMIVISCTMMQTMYYTEEYFFMVTRYLKVHSEMQLPLYT